MDPLKTYITQARQQGQTNGQILETLVGAGWDAGMVRDGLGMPPLRPMVGSVPVEPAVRPLISTTRPSLAAQNKLQARLKAGISVIILLAVVGLIYALVNRQASYQAVAQEFISALQKKDKAKADSLESPALKTFLQKNANAASFYTVCQQSGSLCTASFNNSYLAKATKTYRDYTAASGTKGKEIIYTVKQTASGAAAGGSGCSSGSTETITLAFVPKGHSWLVDFIDQDIDAQAQLCGLGGSQSSVSTSNSSADNDAQAKSQAEAIESMLESYFTNYGYYPGDLTPGPLISQPGFSGGSASNFTAPSGTKFIYSPSPSGCTTDNQQCQHYTLEAAETNGTVIDTIKSFN